MESPTMMDEGVGARVISSLSSPASAARASGQREVKGTQVVTLAPHQQNANGARSSRSRMLLLPGSP